MSDPTVAPPAEDNDAARGASRGSASGADDGLAATVILPPAEPILPGTSETIPCWFGKLPFLGDFASRRLPESFIRPWDEWLQPGLASARDATGERWLDLYLTFPVWRFVMPGGLLGDANWIGVLLPSVDRVGRCFPLTICEPLARSTLEAAGLIGIDLRLAAFAEAGVEALDADSVDSLEQRLSGLGTMHAGGGAATTSPIALEAWLQRPRPGQPAPPAAWALSGTVPGTLAGAASRFVVATLRDRVLWWSPADEAGGSGAMLLEPFPFSAGLLSRLIGTD